MGTGILQTKILKEAQGALEETLAKVKLSQPALPPPPRAPSPQAGPVHPPTPSAGETTNTASADAEKMYREGLKHENGDGTPKAPHRAILHYHAAASHGHVPAQLALARLIYTGSGVEKSYKGAVDLWWPLAQRDIAEAQFCYGYCHHNGTGVAKSLPEAEKWYRLAAGQGHARAAYELGRVLEQQKRSPEKFAAFYKQAAEAGHPGARYRLAQLLELGTGVPKDRTKATEMYCELASSRDDHEWRDEAQDRFDTLIERQASFTRQLATPFRVMMKRLGLRERGT